MNKLTPRKGSLQVLLASALLLTCTATTKAQSSSLNPPFPNDKTPTLEISIFGAGQFWQLHQSNSQTPTFARGGAVGFRETIDFTRYFGMELSTSFGRNNFHFGTQAGTPIRSVGVGAFNQQIYLGPVIYFQPAESRMRVYATIGPAYQNFSPSDDAVKKANSGVFPYTQFKMQQLHRSYDAALVYGVGVKYAATRRIGMRLDLRETFTKSPHFGLPGAPNGPGSVYVPQGGTVTGLQASLGVTFRFGFGPAPVIRTPDPVIPPPAPMMKTFSASLSASPSEVCPGEPVSVSVSGLPSGMSPTMSWTVNGTPTTGGSSLSFTPQTSGSTTIMLALSGTGYDSGSASTTVNVKTYQAPTGSVTASPSSIEWKQTSSLSSNFSGQCGGPIGPATYKASEGSVSGSTFDSSSVGFDPSNNDEQNRTVTITATASDTKGSGSATTTVTVHKAADKKAARLPDLIFAQGSSRVNNCGKRLLLEQLKTYFDKDPTGRVVFVGHDTDREKKMPHLDRDRAMNAAAIMTAGKGICLSYPVTQVLISEAGTKQNGVDYQPYFCGTSVNPKTKERSGSMVSAKDTTAQYRRVEVWFIPTGAQLPSTASDAKEVPAAKGCPK